MPGLDLEHADVEIPPPTRWVVAGGACVVLLLFAGCVLAGATDPSVLGVRVVVTVLTLSFLPGILLLGALGIDLDRAESVVYALMVSLALLMGLGLLMNTLYLYGVFPTPFTKSTLLLTNSGLIVSLIVLFGASGNDPALPSVQWNGIRRIHVFSAVVILCAVLGATSINRYGDNRPALLAIALIAVLTVAIIRTEAERLYPSLVWVLSLALLYLSSLIDDQLFQGDGVWEFYHSNLVLTNGFWDPTFNSTFNSILRVVVLHPLFTQLTGLDLYWEYKIIHPLLFSFVGVALYLTYVRHFSERVSLVSALLYVFTYPFFTRLARDTRSATALLALAAFLLVLSDDRIGGTGKAALLSATAFSLTVSHYGIAILAIVVLSVGLVTYYVHSQFHPAYPRATPKVLAVSVLWFVTVYLAWYSYAGDGVVIGVLTEVINEGIIGEIENMFSTESNAKRSISIAPESFTYLFIKYQYILLVLLAAAGVAAGLATAVWRPRGRRLKTRASPLLDRFPDVNGLYLSLGVGGMFVLAGTVAPTTTMGIKRVFMITMTILLPFAGRVGLGLLGVLGRYRQHAVTAGLVVILLVNSGLVAAVLNERSTHPNIDREDTLESGNEWEQYHLMHRYRTLEEIESSEWLVNHGGPCMVSGSPDTSQEPVTYFGFGGYDRKRPPGIEYNKYDLTPSNGYLYLSTFSEKFAKVYRTNQFTRSASAIATYEELGVSRMSRIYDNGRSGIVLNGECR